MRANLILTFAALGVALAGCAPKRVATVGPTPYDLTVDAGCYTVDLFTPSAVTTPTSDVPTEWHGYLGKWGGGAWEGKWCHDLYVLSISAEGQVDVISAHAPFPEWGLEATAFRRQGFIDEDGRMTVRYKDIVVEYRLEKGNLLGDRVQNKAKMRIKLSQQDLGA